MPLALALVMAVAAVAATAVHLERYPQPSASGDPMYLPQAKYLRPLSLGHAHVLADVLWFRALSHFGRHYRSDRTYPWLSHMCNLVTDLDPRAAHVYRFAGVTLPWEAGDADAGIQLLEKGVRNLPDSWMMHYWLGFNYYFFKSDFTNAAAHLSRAAQLPGADPNAARLAALLYRQQYGADTTRAFLQQLAKDTYDAQMRDVIQRHLLEVQLAEGLERIQNAVNTYRGRFGHDPDTVQTLVDTGLIAEKPVDPFGGSYQIGRDGTVSVSTGVVPARLHQSPLRAKLLRGDSVRD